MRRLAGLLIVISLCVIHLCSLGIASAASTVFYGESDDGYIYETDTTYSTARESGSGDVDDTSYYVRVGQDYINPTYYIYRGILYFDTSDIPNEATISAATLSLYGTGSDPDTDFVLRVIDGSGIGIPCVSTDYESLFNKTTSLGTFDTDAVGDDWANDDYNVITINATGLNVINKDGYTQFGLRSEEDISESSPADVEYVDFYSQEKGYGYEPKLTVTYTIPALDNPDTLEVSNPAVFTNYLESGDQLYVFATEIEYPNDPDYLPSEYFATQLYDEGDNLVAQVSAKRWGYSPLSIYLSADNALTWGGGYTLTLTGLADKFVTPPDDDRVIADVEWRGEARDSDVFRQWIYTTSNRMGIKDGITWSGYRDSVDSSLLNGEATAIFVEGIPYINSFYPDIFVEVGTPTPESQQTVTNDESGDLYDNWGTYWGVVWDGIGEEIGLEGYIVVSLFFFGIALLVTFVLRGKVQPPLNYLAPLPVMLIGFMFGVPLWIALIGGMCSILYFGTNVIIRGWS